MVLSPGLGVRRRHLAMSERRKDENRSADGQADTAADQPPERIAKLIARSGACSRRQAEVAIGQGRVMLDGVPVTHPAQTATRRHKLVLDGRRLTYPCAQLWRLHKPCGVLTQRGVDARGRATLSGLLPPAHSNLMPIGRLDYDSQGLLLLTNDGALKRGLELPAQAWPRRYRVRVQGIMTAADGEKIAKGRELDGRWCQPQSFHIDTRTQSYSWITMVLTQGQNHAVRRLCMAAGFPVVRLIRTAFGPLDLGPLARGALAAVPQEHTRALLAQVARRAAEIQPQQTSWPSKPDARRRNPRAAVAR